MHKIEYNKKLTEDMYLMKVSGEHKGRMGQFYMLRSWDTYPVLSRPISIHNITEDGIEFLYRAVGDGTNRFSKLKAGDEIKLEGPYGNGYPEVKGKIALVGGGMGSAPLYLTAKELLNQGNEVDIYLGDRKEVVLKNRFDEVCNSFTVNEGGFITEDIDVSKYDYVLTCGPEIMMEKLTEAARETKTKVYVSIERHMACGIGACLVCTCKTTEGNKKACKDGPVFDGEEVFF